MRYLHFCMRPIIIIAPFSICSSYLLKTLSECLNVNCFVDVSCSVEQDTLLMFNVRSALDIVEGEDNILQIL